MLALAFGMGFQQPTQTGAEGQAIVYYHAERRDWDVVDFLIFSFRIFNTKTLDLKRLETSNLFKLQIL
ncbi:MAG: hypothetical protein KDC92_11630, partial [Bacteroidetes bacterium]|nr:hypothetical protein [Bacteroidota bacterium]